MIRLGLILALALPLCGKWWRIESGPIAVYTEAGDQSGRQVLEKLDLARRVFAGLDRNRVALPLPVEAFALRSEARFRALRPAENVQGFYQSAAQRDYIVVNLGAAQTERIVFHEYVHMVLNHTSGPLPQWMEEGLAEFHSTLEARNGKVRLGRTIPAHLRLLAVRPWLAGDEIARVTKDSPHFNEASRNGIFYAQSWAMVHMLRLHEGYRAGFAGFLSAVAAGDSQPAALQRAFGKSFPDLIVDLKAYLGRTMLPVVDYAVDLEERAPVESIELPEYDGDLAYAELARSCGRMEEAEKIYGKLRRNKPSARLATALGFLELAAKRPQAARESFERAMEFPDAGAEVFFEYAMLLRDMGASREETRRNLEKAVERNPRYAEAQFLLGVAYAAEERHAEAVRHIEQAVAVFPRQSYFWHALAMSYHALGRKQDAIKASRWALDTASTTEQAEMARAAVRLTESEPDAQVAEKRPSVITPDSWKNKEGDARIEGVLERIECIGTKARFHVRAQGKLTALMVEKPGEVLLKNLSSMTFEFRCGEQKPVPVVVEYMAASGEVTSIEFK